MIQVKQSTALNHHWQELCTRYLPVSREGSIWSYSRARDPDDPEQGWKLHVSATVLNANGVFEKIAPVLAGYGVQFKAPSSLHELMRINSGLHHGYSQVGKFITVYPRTNEEAVSVARRLHKLTHGLPAPAIPFDSRFSPGGNVYYRYGAFKRLELEHPDGTRTQVIRDPEGNLIPDLREPHGAKPSWVDDPFNNCSQQVAGPDETDENPLKTTYRVFRALTQRGKGGVYQAIDLSMTSPRFCLLKEGRKSGEVSWDGRDGCWRVRHEERVLCVLRAGGIEAPRVYSSFELDGNFYLVTEYIEGESLRSLLGKKQRRIPVSRALAFGVELAGLISQIHSAGWVWRDCKPSNIMVSGNGNLRLLDFEGACPIDHPDPMPWGTPGFAPPKEYSESDSRATVYDDLYALGAVIYFMLTGRSPEATDHVPVEKLRRGVPLEAREVISKLLAAAPRHRPSAQMVAGELNQQPILTA